MSNVNQRIQNLSHTSLVPAMCLALLACSAPPTETQTARSQATAPAQATLVAEPQSQMPEAEDVPVRIEKLSFVPGELKSQRDPAVLEYCLDCQVRKARYTYCNFDANELESAVGPENISKTITAKVEMRAQSTKTYVPDDPNAPQPDDGFVHEKYKCTVVEVLSSK